MGKNVHGGGSQTNKNGLRFEQETSLKCAIDKLGKYEIIGDKLFYNKDNVAIFYEKINYIKNY